MTEFDLRFFLSKSRCYYFWWGLSSFMYRIMIKISGVENIQKLINPIENPSFCTKMNTASISKSRDTKRVVWGYMANIDHLDNLVFLICFSLIRYKPPIPKKIRIKLSSMIMGSFPFYVQVPLFSAWFLSCFALCAE